jgi:hypothetical protein
MKTQASRRLTVRIASLAALLALSFPGGAALAKDEYLKESDVPAQVLAAFKKKYPNARADKFEREPGKGTEKGKTIYEIKFRDAGKKLEVELTPEGTIIAEEEVITQKQLPEAVRKSFAETEYGKGPWKLKQIERKGPPDKKDEVIYEIEVMAKGEVVELSYDPAGKLISTEKEDGDSAKN